MGDEHRCDDDERRSEDGQEHQEFDAHAPGPRGAPGAVVSTVVEALLASAGVLGIDLEATAPGRGGGVGVHGWRVSYGSVAAVTSTNRAAAASRPVIRCRAGAARDRHARDNRPGFPEHPLPTTPGRTLELLAVRT